MTNRRQVNVWLVLAVKKKFKWHKVGLDFTNFKDNGASFVTVLMNAARKRLIIAETTTYVWRERLNHLDVRNKKEIFDEI